MAQYPLFPLPETVVFPGMTLPLYIFEERYKRMVKDCLESNQRRLVIVLAKTQAQISDAGPSTYKIGAYADILTLNENPDGTYSMLVHGQDRCQIEDIDTASLPYFTVEDKPFPLERGDPNLETVSAWDCLEVFKDYAKTFFAFDAQKQIEEALPDDLVYQASFVCANIRVPVASRQVLLEAPSLVARFGLAQKLMKERLAEHEASPLADDLSDLA